MASKHRLATAVQLVMVEAFLGALPVSFHYFRRWNFQLLNLMALKLIVKIEFKMESMLMTDFGDKYGWQLWGIFEFFHFCHPNLMTPTSDCHQHHAINNYKFQPCSAFCFFKFSFFIRSSSSWFCCSFFVLSFWDFFFPTVIEFLIFCKFDSEPIRARCSNM